MGPEAHHVCLPKSDAWPALIEDGTPHTRRSPALQVTDPEQIKAGRISVSITTNQENGSRTGPPNVRAPGGGASAGHLPEGKKFFLAPSLKTGKGAAEVKQVNWCTISYTRVSTVGNIELRYETASTLMLRGVLNKSNPAHRELLRSSRDPGGRRAARVRH